MVHALLIPLFLCVGHGFSLYAIDNNGSGPNSQVLFNNETIVAFPAPRPSSAPHLRRIQRIPGRGGGAVFAYDEPTGAFGELCGSESPTFSSVGTAHLTFIDAPGNVSTVVLDVSKVDPRLRAVVDVSISPSSKVAYAIATFHEGGKREVNCVESWLLNHLSKETIQEEEHISCLAGQRMALLGAQLRLLGGAERHL